MTMTMILTMAMMTVMTMMTMGAVAFDPEKDGSGYTRIHSLLHTSDPSLCKDTYVLKGDDPIEPDVHVCLDSIPREGTGCVVYSIGIANNWIFDDYMVSKGCEVFSFDPSMVGVEKHKRHEKHLFEPIGIGTIDGIHQGSSTLYGNNSNYEVETLRHMMDRHGHTHLNVIRMDVESAEWLVLEQWSTNGWFQLFDQLLLEIHMWFPEEEVQEEFILNSIPLKLFHTAQNNFDSEYLHGDMTRVYEMGWMRTSGGCDLSPAMLQSHEFKRFSQYGEDGVIEAIFHCIKPTNDYFVEFGAESGVECNTRNLRENHGWTGLLMDGGNENATFNVHREFIAPDTIVKLLKKYDVPKEFDLLSIDIGTTDLWVMREILGSFRPRVLITEFNSNFDWNEYLTFPRDSTLTWKGDTFFGASLAALQSEAESFGYHLLYTTTESVNAFWIRGDVYPQITAFADVWRGVISRNGMIVDREKFVDPRGTTGSNTLPGRISSTLIPWGGDRGPYPSKAPWECRWVKFHVDNQSAPMCVHPGPDIVSDAIAQHGRWGDCDILSALWYSGRKNNANANATYVEVGGNIGACVMHMLLTTDAQDIRVFEPNPRNLFCLTSTLLRLPAEQLRRVTVYPFGLGDRALVSQSFSAKDNMGNSVVGKIIKDLPTQEFNPPVSIRVAQYDAVIGAEVHVALMKMDAQGFECNIVRGMGERKVTIIKTEIANHGLSSHENCDDKILFDLFKSRAMHVFDEKGTPLNEPKPPGAYYDVVVKQVSYVLGSSSSD